MNISFSTSIKDVLNQIHSSTSIRDTAIKIINTFDNNILKQIIHNADTDDFGHFQHYIEDFLSFIPGSLRVHAITEGQRAVDNYINNLHSGPKAQSLSAQAGLMFPVQKVFDAYPEADVEIAIYICAVLEYLTAEILELSRNEANNNSNKYIIPKYIKEAVNGDSELIQLSKYFNKKKSSKKSPKKSSSSRSAKAKKSSSKKSPKKKSSSSKKSPKKSSSKKSSSSKKKRALKPCKSHQYRDPKTNRCRNISSSKKKKSASPKKKVSKKKSASRKKKTSKSKRKSSKRKCKYGRDKKTGRCIPKKSLSKKKK
jgi:hypothetical protein